MLILVFVCSTGAFIHTTGIGSKLNSHLITHLRIRFVTLYADKYYLSHSIYKYDAFLAI